MVLVSQLRTQTCTPFIFCYLRVMLRFQVLIDDLSHQLFEQVNTIRLILAYL